MNTPECRRWSGNWDELDVEGSELLRRGRRSRLLRVRWVPLDVLVCVKETFLSREETEACGSVWATAEDDDALMRLSLQSPHIVSLLGRVRGGRAVVEVMRLYDCSLDDVSQRRRLSEADGRAIAFQVVLGLDVLHRSGFVHRDVTASNILLDGGGGVVALGDLTAVARVTRPGGVRGAEGGGASPFSGTWATASYEALRSTEFAYSPADDVWSLGVVLYRVLGGCHPFLTPGADASVSFFALLHDLDRARGRGAPPPPIPGVSREAMDFFERTLSWNREARASAAELLHRGWLAPVSLASSTQHVAQVLR